MTIELNGRPTEVPSGARVGDAISQAGGDPQRRGVAVAIDGAVVPRSEWERTELREGQRVEVVGAIQGG
jgi:sulfur carrier protein